MIRLTKSLLIIGISIFGLQACINQAINGALYKVEDGVMTALSTKTTKTYPVNTYLFYLSTAMIHGKKSPDEAFFKKMWGDPEEVYSGKGYHVDMWWTVKKGVKTCRVYIGFDPKTKMMNKFDFFVESGSAELCGYITTDEEIETNYKLNMVNGNLTLRNWTRDDNLVQWLGKDEDDLIKKWGIPAKKMTLKNGEKMLTWQDDWYSSTLYTESWGTCEHTMFTDKHGKIISWRYSGCKNNTFSNKVPKVVPIPKPPKV